MTITRQSTTTDQPFGPLRAMHQRAMVMSPPSSARLRSELLHKLGIVSPRTDSHMPRNRDPSLLGRVQLRSEPLKYDDRDGESKQEEEQSSPTSSADHLFRALGAVFYPQDDTSKNSLRSLDESSTGSISNDDGPRRIHFDEKVTVIPIPRHQDYSDRIRKTLWDPLEDVQKSILRNTLEYAADGCDYQTAREEDEHYRHPETGVLIHPIHCEIAKIKRQQRGLPEEGATLEELLHTI